MTAPLFMVVWIAAVDVCPRWLPKTAPGALRAVFCHTDYRHGRSELVPRTADAARILDDLGPGIKSAAVLEIRGARTRARAVRWRAEILP